MTTRRDFLKGFAALASGLALAPASALAQVQRLGSPAEWVEPETAMSAGVRSMLDTMRRLTGEVDLSGYVFAAPTRLRLDAPTRTLLRAERVEAWVDPTAPPGNVYPYTPRSAPPQASAAVHSFLPPAPGGL
jgi:hypothetical protein